MKKHMFIIISTAIIVCIIIGVILLKNTTFTNESNSVSVQNDKENTSSLEIARNDKKEIIIEQTSEINSAFNMKDSKVRDENSEFIIIGTIESVDGGINYNPATKEYTNIQTIGNIKVLKTIKGEITKDVIPYIRLGGIIKLSDYEEGLSEAQKNKFEEIDSIKKLTAEEKENKYVSYLSKGNINPEAGKTYLMYMKYSEEYGRYGIVFFEHGLREINSNDVDRIINSNSKILTKEEKENIKVLNNSNKEYEILKDVIEY